MDIGRAGNPRHERSIFDGVPGPIATPAEHFVGPASAEHDARGENAPREERPTTSRSEPGRSKLTRNHCGECEGEGQGEARKAGIQQDRMNHHDRMLKQGVEAVAVRESVRVRYPLEGERLEINEPEEERNIREHRHTHPRHELSVLRAIKDHGDGAVSRQHPTPEQQRSGLPAPQGSKPVVQGHRARGVSRHIT